MTSFDREMAYLERELERGDLEEDEKARIRGELRELERERDQWENERGAW